MLWLGALHVCLLLGSGAVAGTVSMRSGEHPGFSRMVLDLDVLPRWALESDGDRRRLTFDGPLTRIDVSGVYDRMARRRVADIRAGVNEIIFDLGCSCAVAVFGLPGGRLVIDVRDGPGRQRVLLARDTPQSTGREEIGFARPQVLNESLAAPPEVGPSPGPAFGVGPVLGRSPRIDHPVGVDFARLAPVRRSRPAGLPRPTTEITPAQVDTVSGPLLLPVPERRGGDPVDLTLGDLSPFGQRQRISEATSALVDALDRAGELGLVDRVERDAPVERTRLPERPPPGAPLPLPLGDAPSLRVTTSLDRDLARIASALGDRAARTGCLDGYDLDVGSWGDPDDPMNGFAQSRQGLVGEFDAPDLEAARALVQSYLFLSFGAEAKSVLAAFPFDSAERAVYSFLAEVADGGIRPANDEVAGLVGCPGPAAMWALLSIADLPVTADVAKSEIASVFSALPLHLRKQYGPILVQRFLALEDPGTARVIWNAVDRAESSASEEFILATAELAAANGDTRAAERAYASLEGASPGNAPQAVVRLIRSRLSRGALPDPGLLDTAAALSFENRGTALARELKIEELRGRTARDQWDRVFEELPRAEFAGALSRADSEALLVAHFIALADRADVTTFLRRAFEANDRLARRPGTDPARRAIATRLTDLGFTDTALALLGTLSVAEDGDLLIAARANLTAGRAEAALAELPAGQGPEANLLRGQALAQLGAFDDAAAAFAEGGAPDLAAAVSERSGDWTGGGGAISTAAARLLETDETFPNTPLARNRTLADTAQGLRDDISALRQATAGLLGPTD